MSKLATAIDSDPAVVEPASLTIEQEVAKTDSIQHVQQEQVSQAERVYKHTLPDGREVSGSFEQARALCEVIGRMTTEEARATLDEADLSQRIAERGRAARMAKQQNSKAQEAKSSRGQEALRKPWTKSVYNASEKESNSKGDAAATEEYNSTVHAVSAVEEVDEAVAERADVGRLEVRQDDNAYHNSLSTDSTGVRVDSGLIEATANLPEAVTLSEPVEAVETLQVKHDRVVQEVEIDLRPVREEILRRQMLQSEEPTPIQPDEVALSESTVNLGPTPDTRVEAHTQSYAYLIDSLPLTAYESTARPDGGSEHTHATEIVDGAYETTLPEPDFDSDDFEHTAELTEPGLGESSLAVHHTEISLEEEFLWPAADSVDTFTAEEVMDVYHELVAIVEAQSADFAYEDDAQKEAATVMYAEAEPDSTEHPLIIAAGESHAVEGYAGESTYTVEIVGVNRFEEFVAAEPAPKEPPTLEAIRTEAAVTPLENGLLKLARYIAEAKGEDADRENIVRLVQDVSKALSKSLQKTAIDRQEKYTAEDITPELTHKLLVLLNALGYQKPEEALKEFVSRHDLEYLIQAVRYLARLANDDNRQELLLSGVTASSSVSESVLARISKSIFNIIRTKLQLPELMAK